MKRFPKYSDFGLMSTIVILIFISHKFNLPNSSIKIQLEDISEIIERKTIGIINNGLRIKTKNGLRYDFVVNDRKSWIEKLKK